MVGGFQIINKYRNGQIIERTISYSGTLVRGKREQVQDRGPVPDSRVLVKTT